MSGSSPEKIRKQAIRIDLLLGADAAPVRKTRGAAPPPSTAAAEPPARQVPSAPVRPAPSPIEPPMPRPVKRPAAAAPVAATDHPAADMPIDATLSLDRAGRINLLNILRKPVETCRLCGLCATRTNTVFGVGNPEARIMFVGEGPGADEDAKGEPFVGRAGELLDRQIVAMGLSRSEVYIANIHRQIDIIRPAAIVALGATATKYLLQDPKLAITRIRGNWYEYRGIPLMPTFHPAYLLRSYTQENRGKVWSDLKAVLARVGLPVP